MFPRDPTIDSNNYALMTIVVNIIHLCYKGTCAFFAILNYPQQLLVELDVHL